MSKKGKKNIRKMATNEENDESKRKKHKLLVKLLEQIINLRTSAFIFSLPAHSNQLICPITYSTELPEPASESKFLPCGKTLLDFTTEPVSFPRLETQFNHEFKGLHLLLDIDSVNQNAYNTSNGKKTINVKDAALLKDIEAVHINDTKPKVVNNVPTRRQNCREPIGKCAVPHPRSGLQAPQLKSTPLEPLQTLSLELQKEIINQTFLDIEKPLETHPTKVGSNARPLSILPIFPETHLSTSYFVQVQFGIAPSALNNGIIRDCGDNLINFKVNPELLPDHAEEANRLGIRNYLSDQRYKEERTATTMERAEHYMLREKDDSFCYQMIHQYMKLRKLRPSPQALASLCLLV